METNRRGDLVINGLGSSNGGHFSLVTLNGSGTINSDLVCEELECNGSGTLKGNVAATKVNVNGNARFHGTIEGEKLKVDGTAKVAQDLLVQNVKVSGKVNVEGKVKAEQISIHGILTVGEDCEAESFKGKYRFTIGGLLNAGEIDVEVYGECKAKEIGGQTITVKQHKGSFIGAIFKPFFKNQLETDLIEGDKIVLENTVAKVVRGHQVKIGPNCQIGVVEYTDEFSQDKDAVVGDIQKI
ncbi:polymer-forming cytoskeletal protein [Neobacillus drentensis]|uniref:polymer-forming cytoskeletal protein n=1 Tax=Neobacillus drentensis TaxID=220684 RepID=UPI001F3154EF|nr:polymer-forming cytoskeletal protein [Neobacillus drentensis]ULT57303.1 polymer-forming cytoskeletal protein [Neobacillus drentensis]